LIHQVFTAKCQASEYRAGPRMSCWTWACGNLSRTSRTRPRHWKGRRGRRSCRSQPIVSICKQNDLRVVACHAVETITQRLITPYYCCSRRSKARTELLNVLIEHANCQVEMTIWQKCYWAKDPERHDVSTQERITSRSQYHHHDAIVMKGLEVFRDAESRRVRKPHYWTSLGGKEG
jgi:hypothetical protein